MSIGGNFDSLLNAARAFSVDSISLKKNLILIYFFCIMCEKIIKILSFSFRRGLKAKTYYRKFEGKKLCEEDAPERNIVKVN